VFAPRPPFRTLIKEFKEYKFMPVTKQYIDSVNQVLEPTCPLCCKDEAAIADLAKKIQTYDEKLGQPPSPEIVCNWAAAHEKRLRAPIDAENAAYQAEQDRIAARKKAREYDLAPSSINREEVLQEHRQQVAASQHARLPFRPRKQFSEAEMDAMDSVTYAREVLGQERQAEAAQADASGTYLKPPERPGTRRVRRLKFPQEQLEAAASRQREIDADKDERKRLQAALRAAAKKEGR
jgi:hypothetical protein